STDGELRAYAAGAVTAGPGEPIGARRGPGYVSIDIRGADAYSAATASQIGDPNAANPLTPAQYATANQAQPLVGLNGTTAETDPFALDWGDTLYIVAWGVYYAQPTDINNPNPSPPTIQVTSSLGTSAQATVYAHGNRGDIPDDPGMVAGDKAA